MQSIIIQEIIKSSNAKKRFYFSIEIIDGKNFSSFFTKSWMKYKTNVSYKKKWNEIILRKQIETTEGILIFWILLNLTISNLNELILNQIDQNINNLSFKKKEEILNEFNVLFFINHNYNQALYIWNCDILIY